MVMRTWWLVDGMNVIGSRPDGGWRDRTRAMRTLVAQLEVMSVRERRDVTVGFDGRPRHLDARAVDVLFAGPGRDAADREVTWRIAAPPALPPPGVCAWSRPTPGLPARSRRLAHSRCRPAVSGVSSTLKAGT